MRAASGDPFCPRPIYPCTLLQASPTAPPWISHAGKRGGSPRASNPKSSFKASSPLPPTPKPVCGRAGPGRPLHKARQTLGHRAGWPHALQGFLGLTGSACGFLLLRLAPGARHATFAPLNVSCLGDLLTRASTSASRGWACRKVWASKGPNAFLITPRASPKGRSAGSHQSCAHPRSRGTQPPTAAGQSRVGTPGPSLARGKEHFRYLQVAIRK